MLTSTPARRPPGTPAGRPARSLAAFATASAIALVVSLASGAVEPASATPPAPTEVAASSDESWHKVRGTSERWRLVRDSDAAADQSWHSGGSYRDDRGFVLHCVRDSCEDTFPRRIDPELGGATQDLRSVSARSTDDVWVAGTSGPRGIVARWDGTRWKAVLLEPGLQLAGVSVVSPTEVWVVGSRDLDVPVALRWDGDGWTELAPPSDVCADPQAFEDVVGASRPTALLRCGRTGRMVIVEHLDDRGWVRQKLRGDAASVRPVALAAVEDEAWAVGYSPSARPGILHRADGRWRFEDAPVERLASDVAARTTDDVWVVGMTPSESRLAARWDGETWASVESPGIGAFTSVALLDDGTVYASVRYLLNMELARWG